MKRDLLSASLCLLFFLVSSPVFSVQPAYIGAKKCKECHSGSDRHNVFEKWAKSKHALTFEVLKKKGEEKNPKCLYCHTTGYKENGYEPGAANAKEFEGVQCESCHGPGSLYLSIDHSDIPNAVGKGLIIPMEALCIKCHNEDCPTFKGFDYKKYYKKITHIYRKQL